MTLLAFTKLLLEEDCSKYDLEQSSINFQSTFKK